MSFVNCYFLRFMNYLSMMIWLEFLLVDIKSFWEVWLFEGDVWHTCYLYMIMVCFYLIKSFLGLGCYIVGIRVGRSIRPRLWLDCAFLCATYVWTLSMLILLTVIFFTDYDQLICLGQLCRKKCLEGIIMWFLMFLDQWLMWWCWQM